MRLYRVLALFSLCVMSLMLVYMVLFSPVFATTLVVTWDKNTESDLAGYNVYHKVENDVTWTRYPVSKDKTTASISALDNVKYCVEVTALDVNGNESLRSDQVCVILDTLPPEKPKGVKVMIQKLISWLKNILG